MDGFSLDGRLMGNRTFRTVTGLVAGAVAMGKALIVDAPNVDLRDRFASDFVWAFRVCTL